MFSLIQLLPKPLQKHVIQTSAMYLTCALHFQTGKKEVLLLSALTSVLALRVLKLFDSARDDMVCAPLQKIRNTLNYHRQVSQLLCV